MKKVAIFLIIFMNLFSVVPAFSVESTDTSYDPRKEGKVTQIRDQGELNTCWDFAGIAVLETFLKHNDMGDYDLSEEHANWWCTTQNDGTGWFRGSNGIGWQEAIIGYLISGEGVKTEEEVPYNGTYSDTKPSNMDSAKTIFDVTDIVYVNSDINSVKQAISKYGAVSSRYVNNLGFYGDNQNSYYNNNENGYNDMGHMIAIVGWDDNYSKDKFVVTPSRNGAWLVKNSWGKNNSEGGYLWISYEDRYLLKTTTNFAIKGAKKLDENQKIYAHDKYGSTSFASIFNFKDDGEYNKLTCANVYDFTDEHNILSSCRIMINSINTKYEISYTKVVDGNLDIKNKIKLAEGNAQDAGYIDVPINNYVVPKGKGAIIVSLSSDDKDTVVQIGCEISSYEMFNAEVNEGESYIILNDKAYDVTKYNLDNPMNFTIKAITKLSHDNLISNFTIGKYNVFGLFSDNTFTLSVPSDTNINDLNMNIKLNNSYAKIVKIGDVNVDKSEYSGRVPSSDFKITCIAPDGSEKNYNVLIDIQDEKIEEKSYDIYKVLFAITIVGIIVVLGAIIIKYTKKL